MRWIEHKTKVKDSVACEFYCISTVNCLLPMTMQAKTKNRLNGAEAKMYQLKSDQEFYTLKDLDKVKKDEIKRRKKAMKYCFSSALF